METGFIKLHRKIRAWEWYDDIPTKTLFLHLLISANFKDKTWRGIDVKAGDFITSIDHLAECGLSKQQVRTALKKLEKSSDVTRRATSKYTIISLCNYSLYNGSENESNTLSNKRATNEQQTNNKQITNEQQQLKNEENEETANNGKNEKNFSNNKEQNQDFAEPIFEYENHYPTLEDEKALEKLDSEKVKPKPKSKFPFQIFWGLYPLKKGKAQAEKTWKRMSEESRAFAINSISRYVASVNPQFLKHGSTYLSQKVWEDDLSPRQQEQDPREAKRAVADNTRSEIQQIVAKSRESRLNQGALR